MTKTAVFSAIAVLAFSALPASAQTADRPAFAERAAAIQSSPAREARAAQQPVPAAPFAAARSWAGFYIGAGYGRERSRIDQAGLGSAFLDGSFGPDTTDFYKLQTQDYINKGHVLGGYLAQFGNVLIGVEGDYTFGARSQWNLPFGPEDGGCGVGTTGNFICGQPSAFGYVETLGHLRAIAGFEITPSLMGFISGGAAFARGRDVGAHVGFTLVSNPSFPTIVSAIPMSGITRRSAAWVLAERSET